MYETELTFALNVCTSIHVHVHVYIHNTVCTMYIHTCSLDQRCRQCRIVHTAVAASARVQYIAMCIALLLTKHVRIVQYAR